MKKSEILKERRTLKILAGKSEYLFFTSILLSAAAFCIIAVLAVDALMRTPEVYEVYGSSIKGMENFSVNLSPNLPAFISAGIDAFKSAVIAAFRAAPSILVFLSLMLFIVCPVYQGTIRWCAYLIEERQPLPIRAILFYFLSPAYYFPCILISLKIFARKFFWALLFLLPPAFCFGLSLVLGTDYYDQRALAAACLILSVVWFVLASILYFIFCQRYSAVRYLFALGFTKKLFATSKEVTLEKRAWFFTLRLRLMLNLFLALGIVTAPAAFSRIICGNCLAVRSLLADRKKAA